ncbi:MAG TPA: anthranilate phosphoribosyltransferase [Candidatus Micrarchaeia archaeon]|nr:anthranilate phosphoribosyltransferase [Candidatus Micrarchaeia archaeon]
MAVAQPESPLVPAALARMVLGEDLDRETSRRVGDAMMDGTATAAQVGALLALWRVRGETVEELCGLALSMRSHALRVELPSDAVDTCGTGGDGLGTFNISTAAALVVAGAGCPVAKHGNRAVSSRAGSADVLEALGVRVALSPVGVAACVTAAGIGFMFAPAFHPAWRHVSGPRRELGIRSVFNLLGPLANPGGVRFQVVGTGDPRAARRMAQVLGELGTAHGLVVAGPDGLDELGLAGPSAVYEVRGGEVTERSVDPAQLGLAPAPTAALAGAGAEANAAIIRRVLDDEPGPARDVVCLNAAAALLAADRVPTLVEGLVAARASLAGGRARAALAKLVATSTACG